MDLEQSITNDTIDDNYDLSLEDNDDNFNIEDITEDQVKELLADEENRFLLDEDECGIAIEVRVEDKSKKDPKNYRNSSNLITINCEDDEEDEDEEERRHPKFKRERVINLTSHKERDIPDSLDSVVLNEKDQAHIQMTKKKHKRSTQTSQAPKIHVNPHFRMPTSSFQPRQFRPRLPHPRLNTNPNGLLPTPHFSPGIDYNSNISYPDANVTNHYIGQETDLAGGVLYHESSHLSRPIENPITLSGNGRWRQSVQMNPSWLENLSGYQLRMPSTNELVPNQSIFGQDASYRSQHGPQKSKNRLLNLEFNKRFQRYPSEVNKLRTTSPNGPFIQRRQSLMQMRQPFRPPLIQQGSGHRQESVTQGSLYGPKNGSRPLSILRSSMRQIQGMRPRAVAPAQSSIGPRIIVGPMIRHGQGILQRPGGPTLIPFSSPCQRLPSQLNQRFNSPQSSQVSNVGNVAVSNISNPTNQVSGTVSESKTNKRRKKSSKKGEIKKVALLKSKAAKKFLQKKSRNVIPVESVNTNLKTVANEPNVENAPKSSNNDKASNQSSQKVVKLKSSAKHNISKRTEKPLPKSTQRRLHSEKQETKEQDKKEKTATSEESKQIEKILELDIDDEYKRKLEQQKRLREEIIRRKEERRRLLVAGKLKLDESKPNEKKLDNKTSPNSLNSVRVGRNDKKSVEIGGLAMTTNELTIMKLCKSVGPIESCKMDNKKGERKAIVTFKCGEDAVIFQRKYQRHLVDLCVIQVSLIW